MPVAEPALPILVPARLIQTLRSCLPFNSHLSLSLAPSGLPTATATTTHFFHPETPILFPLNLTGRVHSIVLFFRDLPLLLVFTNKLRVLNVVPAQLGMEACAFYWEGAGGGGAFDNLHDEDLHFDLAECAWCAHTISQILGETIMVAENMRPYAPSL